MRVTQRSIIRVALLALLGAASSAVAQPTATSPAAGSATSSPNDHGANDAASQLPPSPKIEPVNKPAGERQTKAETAPSVNPLDRISTRIENRIASRIETRIGRVPTDPVEVDDAYREAQDRVRQAGRR